MIDHASIKFLGDIPGVQARVHGEEIALSFEGRSMSYAELERRAGSAARLLTALGVKAGDRVAWLGRNCDRFFEVFFGAAEIRACLAPINTRLAPPEVAFILQDSGADVLFVTGDQAERVREVLERLDRPARVLVVEGSRSGFDSYEAMLRDEAAPTRTVAPQADDDVLQLYTSGTTGLPKGVRLNNANYGWFLRTSGQVEGFAYDAGDTVLIVMPLFHVAGTNISFAALASGCRVIVLAEFNTAEVLRLIEAERVAHLFLVPAMIQALLQRPEIATADLSSLKTIAYGASPIGEAVLAQAQSRFRCGFIQFYGMTETAGAGSFLAPAAHTPDMLRSCGRPWPTLEMRIQDENGRELPIGEIGEIAIRGGPVMAGYWSRLDATAATVSADGWLRTGDAGFRDPEGFFFVHDRVKDMIVTGGENVYPAEVENAILGCPGVADVAVIGVPSERWGEEVKALVVPAAGDPPEAQDVIAWARRSIAGFKTPKTVEFVQALPRNASGKVLRRDLRAPYWAGRDRQVG